MVPEARFVIIWRLHSDTSTLQTATLFREAGGSGLPGGHDEPLQAKGSLAHGIGPSTPASMLLPG